MSNQPDQPAAPQPAKPPKERKRKPHIAKPRAARVKDPGIEAIEREAKEKKSEYRKAQASGAVLKRILALLPKLTADDLRTVAVEVTPDEGSIGDADAIAKNTI